MKMQYQTPKLTVGVLVLMATLIPIALGYFLVTGMAESPCYPSCAATTVATSTSSTPSPIVVVSMYNGAGIPTTGAPGYAPDKITVVIGVNNTVVWNNNDTAHHTVTSVSGNGTISSGDMAPGASFTYTFTTPGTFNYLCVYHAWMVGTVKVVAGSSGPSIVKVSMYNGAGIPTTGAPGYSPDVVHIVAGSIVVWTNNDTAHHTVTSVSGNGSISSGDMAPGASFNYTFTTPGTYDYLCIYHAWMVGTVIVTPASVTGTGNGQSSTPQVAIPNGAGAGQQGAPGYAPDRIKVVLGVNNTVEWTNKDTAHHTVTSVSGNGTISSGDMAPGATFNYTFTAPGTYDYICIYHAWMSGTVVVVAGSGSSGTSSTTSVNSVTTTGSTSTGGAPANAIKISMPNGAGLSSGGPGYAPDKITVIIGVNNTVTWANNDTAHHTVTSETVPAGASMFNSNDMAPGATFTYTFTVPGTYTYICIYHSWMVGTITVIAA